jgi:hypothetical protein
VSHSGAPVALNIRHQLPHRLRLDCPQELSNEQLLLIETAMQQLQPDWLVRAAAHRRGVVVSSQPEQRLCPAVVAGLVDAALRAPDPHGPAAPPTPLQRLLGQSRQGSIKVLMALAIAGWVLPILPGTPFFLLAWWLGWRPEPEAEPAASAEAKLQPALLQPST